MAGHSSHDGAAGGCGAPGHIGFIAGQVRGGWLAGLQGFGALQEALHFKSRFSFEPLAGSISMPGHIS